jgi:hypothetical protein
VDLESGVFYILTVEKSLFGYILEDISIPVTISVSATQ